jgi:nucleoside 2-deoxyribosyltransferase
VFALLLPSSDDQSAIESALQSLGHSCARPGTKEECLELFYRTDVILAAGKLTETGIWMWGYAFAKQKKVLAFSGVEPCMVSNTVNLNKWLDKIPVQTGLFDNLRPKG